MTARQMDRRQFLAAAAASAGAMQFCDVLAAEERRLPSNTPLRLAVVGMAGYGAYHGFGESIHVYDNVEYTVSCDVDRRKVQRVYNLWEQRADEWPHSDNANERRAAEHYVRLAKNKPPLYADFREMFDKASEAFDAVVVATPDHTHAVIAAAALRAGKPVLAEKPLAISAHEARALHRLARESGVATQVNTGGAASPGFRRGVEVVREGLLGEVREVHFFFSRGGVNYQTPPQGTEPVPPELDWNLWLAQVAWREYHPGWINRIAWRDTSIGELGNFGPHSANMAFLSLNVASLWGSHAPATPIEVHAECSDVNALSYPRWERIRWEVPAHGEWPPVTFTWHHGWPPDYAPGSREQLARILRDHGAGDEEAEQLLPYAGCLIVGSRGVLATNSHNTEISLLPKRAFENIEQRRPLTLPPSPGHYKEWIEACRGGAKPLSCFDHMAPMAEFLAVGSLATRFPGETLKFDPTSGRITNLPRAAEFLHYDYRDGWAI
jgi:hypothetical protein